VSRRLISSLAMAMATVLVSGLMFFAISAVFSRKAYAASTYYLATTGDDGGPGTIDQPWATFARANANMTAGDTLIVRDGTYVQSLSDPVSGTPFAYTTIKAENDGRVVVDGSCLGEWQNALDIYDRRFVQVEGIKFRGGRADGCGNSAGCLSASDHVKVLRCSFYDPSTRSAVEDPGGTNYPTLSITGCSYCLLEDCWAWGYGRYRFESYESDHVIMRRCVARYDRMKAHYPMAVFSIYSAPYNQLQNCIAIDSDQDAYYTGTDESSEGFYGGILAPNCVEEYANTGLKYLGCIALNVSGDQGCGSLITYGTHTIRDTVVWDCKGGVAFGLPHHPSLSLDHVTVGATYGTHSDSTWSGGVGAVSWTDGVGTSVRNSQFLHSNEYGIFDLRGSDYNNFWDNRKGDYGNSFGQSHTVAGLNDSYLDPGQKYILRVEEDSPLCGRASDGGDVGATVLNRYGVSGTLWGEPGYEDLTSENLWPWPYEARISNDMRSYTGPPSGVRGFCAYGMTLSRYIWEYLGNPMPEFVSHNWYFAEGTTRDNPNDGTYEEWLCLQNPGAADAQVTLTYMLGEGTTENQYVTVEAEGRLTVSVNDFLGPDKDVSTLVESDQFILVERPMYFNYRNKWTGGHDVMGVPVPRDSYYFAEGTTRDNANDGSYEEWLCLQNPGGTDADVKVTYMLGTGQNIEETYPVGATSRETVDVNTVVGPDQDVSMLIESTQPIVAERPMYFNYRNKWNGGHNVVGAPGPDTEFFFAEGTTRDNANDGSYEEWLCLQNPGDTDADVTITYYTAQAGTQTEDVTVGAGSRCTVDVKLKLGADVDTACKVESTNNVPILVERPMYFNYHSIWPGGHDVMGCNAPSKSYYFAEGTTLTDFNTYVAVMNPGANAATVKFTYVIEGEPSQQTTVTIDPGKRFTLDVASVIGVNKNVSMLIESDEQIVAERPMYFGYKGWCAGGHDTLGYGI